VKPAVKYTVLTTYYRTYIVLPHTVHTLLVVRCTVQVCAILYKPRPQWLATVIEIVDRDVLEYHVNILDRRKFVVLTAKVLGKLLDEVLYCSVLYLLYNV
jgi:hypothetical protein